MISLLRNLENAAPPSDKVMAVIIMKGNPETAVKFFDIFFSEATPDELAFLLTKAQENEHLELAEYFQRRLDEL
jgi:hypothetical protein